MARDRSEFSGAMVASALLHVGIFAAALIGWPWAKQLPVGSAVPINIVANAPSTNLAPAMEGPEELPAQTEAPLPDAPTPPAAPEPAPVPTPPPRPNSVSPCRGPPLPSSIGGGETAAQPAKSVSDSTTAAFSAPSACTIREVIWSAPAGGTASSW